MMDFTFNNTSFKTLTGGYVLARYGFLSAKRDYTTIEIPGRDGELTLDNGRYKDADGYYACYVKDYTENMGKLAALFSQPGYFRLTDSVEDDVYRQARFTDIQVKKLIGDEARLDIYFNLMPQRWLLAGETEEAVASGDVLTNPTVFPAKPIIKLTGAGSTDGSIVIGTMSIEIPAGFGNITIDCEAREAYNATTSLNHLISDFPTLTDSTTITYTNVSNVKIQPRWCRL